MNSIYISRFKTMARVINALIYRETKTRFGQKKLGYAWVLLEPVAQIAVFAAIFGVFMNRVMPGIDYIVFLTIGVVGWNLFNDTLNQSLGAVSSNLGLLIYNKVKPIDTVISRAILEGMIFWIVLPTILVFLHFISHPIKYIDLGQILIGFISLWIISIGLGMFFAVLAAIKQETKWVLNVILKPLYFLSAIMYSVSTIPGEYQKILLFNPLVHAIGLMRGGFIENYDSYYVDGFYLFMWCLVTLFLGISAFVAKEHRLRMG